MKRRFWLIFRLLLGFALLLLFTICLEITMGWRCPLQGQIHAPVPEAQYRELATAEIKGYSRPEDDTFLSYPEWYIVWSYQEKADFQEHHLPSAFPYFASVRQYWGSYCCISRLIRGKYPFNGGEQMMLAVIGTSFSAEYILKGAYEKTIGRISEWSSHHEMTEEDDVAYRVAREYADFVHIRPFYEFHFARQVPRLWRDTHLFAPHFFRKWERKFFLTADYLIEASYCSIIEELTHLSYGFEPTETYAWINESDPAVLSSSSRVKTVKQVGPSEFIVGIPRYQEFTTIAAILPDSGIQFVEIAGNSQILLSVIAPKSWRNENGAEEELFSTPVLTQPDAKREVLSCDVAKLTSLVKTIRNSGAKLEHIYDY